MDIALISVYNLCLSERNNILMVLTHRTKIDIAQIYFKKAIKYFAAGWKFLFALSWPVTCRTTLSLWYPGWSVHWELCQYIAWSRFYFWPSAVNSLPLGDLNGALDNLFLINNFIDWQPRYLLWNFPKMHVMEFTDDKSTLFQVMAWCLCR